MKTITTFALSTALQALAICFASTALAQPSNTLNISAGTCAAPGTGIVNITQTGAIGQSQGTLATSSGGCNFGVQARAGGGGVGILSTLTIAGGFTTPSNSLTRVVAQSIVEIDLGVPANFAGGLIPVSFSPHLNGVAFASVTGSPFSSRNSRARLIATVSISGTGSPPPGNHTATAIAQVTAAASVNNPAGTGTDSVSLPTSLFPPTIFIDPTQPIEVTFTMDAEMAASVFNNAIADAGVDALNSLSFALSGPALILPDGFTANSVSGQIVDNVFVGQGAVPEPGTLALFGIGLVGLLTSRRRKK